MYGSGNFRFASGCTRVIVSKRTQKGGDYLVSSYGHSVLVTTRYQGKEKHWERSHMNKVSKLAASTTLALGLVLGGGVAANAAGSIGAGGGGAVSTYTYKQGPEKWQWDRYWNGTRYMCGVWAYIDYNWWEEVFQGKRDGWQRLYYAYC